MTNIQDLRKIYSAQGIKGFSSANRAAFTANIETAHTEALEIHEGMMVLELAAAAAEATRNEEIATALDTAPAKAKKGTCEDCGRKVGKSGHPSLCEVCLDYAGWENTHQDGHDGDDTETLAACPVCHPELDARTAKPTGKSRMGMVIVAKGSEVHKSETFRVAAEAAGWTVTVTSGGEDHFYADAHKDGNAIQLAWEGRAYDYPASSATFGGKSRKVRNLKEALRLL